MNVLGAACFGLALGIVTGMPPGIINMAIVGAATTGRHRFAGGLALGGGAADTVHASLAFAGIGQLVTARPEWVRVMAIAAAVVIATYVVITWRAQKAQVAGQPAADRGIVRGVLTGIAITLPNPAALGAWVAVATATWPAASIATAVSVGDRKSTRLNSSHYALSRMPSSA